MKKIFVLLFMATILVAGEITQLGDLNNLKFEDAFEKKVTIPLKTKKVIVSFGKKSNSFMSEYLNKKEKNFLPKNDSIFIGDIHNMPSMITYMFARPKMQKYNFTVFLYNEKGLEKFIPRRKDKVTIMNFDSNGKIIDISFSDKAKEVF